MPSFFEKQLQRDPRSQPDGSQRRHTVDHGTTRVIDKPRENSVTSVSSHKSEPIRRSSANDTDKRRSSSIASSADSLGESKSSGLKGLFGKNKGEKPKKEKIVITSRHSGAVKSKLAVDPGYRRLSESKASGVEGVHKITHSLAEEQEMRHPHSGPPSVRKPPGKNTPSILTKIASGDEQDEEDELDRIRSHLTAARLKNDPLDRVPEDGHGEIHNGEEQVEEEESPEPLPELTHESNSPESVSHLDVDGLAKHKLNRLSIGGGWTRDEKGKWTR